MSIIQKMAPYFSQMESWLASQEEASELPLYSSMDIRDAGFKMAVVDTNLFPAGFNNLCALGLEGSREMIRQAIDQRVPGCRNILIVAEDHTRNTWYLENVRVLQTMIEQAGFDVKIATFLCVEPEVFSENIEFMELTTATGLPLKVYCMNKIVKQLKEGQSEFDLIILNNDLTSGVPEILQSSEIPIYPPVKAGWHRRLKSEHFSYVKQVFEDLCRSIDCDPWLFTCLDATVENVNINSLEDRERLMAKATELLQDIQAKYDQHGIEEKPFIFLKADSGTYGMGVMAIEDPLQILQLNRKGRNKLSKGKSAKVIERFLLQEGVPSIHRVDGQTSEICVYQIANQSVGAFHRYHSAKGGRDNLNSQGMEFRRICQHGITSETECKIFLGGSQANLMEDTHICGILNQGDALKAYELMARIAGLAAQREIARIQEPVVS